jgi:hypothetical protein
MTADDELTWADHLRAIELLTGKEGKCSTTKTIS